MIDSETEIKGLGRKHTANTHNKTSLIRTSHICHRRRAAGRNQEVEGYKHTHTHVAINSTTKRRRIQYIETRILGSREDTIWMTIITLTEYV